MSRSEAPNQLLYLARLVSNEIERYKMRVDCFKPLNNFSYFTNSSYSDNCALSSGATCLLISSEGSTLSSVITLQQVRSGVECFGALEERHRNRCVGHSVEYGHAFATERSGFEKFRYARQGRLQVAPKMRQYRLEAGCL